MRLPDKERLPRRHEYFPDSVTTSEPTAPSSALVHGECHRRHRWRISQRVHALDTRPQVDEWTFPDGHSIIMLSEGRLLNLGNATGHPSFVMSNSFTNQVLAQIELFTKSDEYELGVHVLPKHLDEMVARLHLDALGVHLTELSKPQAEYLGLDVAGPYKPETYRY